MPVPDIDIFNNNIALAFKWLIVNYDRELSNAAGDVYRFRICDTQIHMINLVTPLDGKTKLLLEIYILDPDEQTRLRMEIKSY